MELNIKEKGNIPLSKLEELVGRRAGELNMAIKDSAIAGMIQVFNSLKNATKTAKLSAKANPRIEIQTNLFPSVTTQGGHKKICLRDSRPSRGKNGTIIKPDLPVRWEKTNNKINFKNFKEYKVFLVIPEFDKENKYLFVARSISTVRKYEQERIKKRINKYRGLAKHAISLTQKKLGGQSSLGNSNTEISRLSEEVSKADIQETEKSCKVTAEDNLRYAISALKNKEAELDNAIKKATNKISGLLAQAAKRYGISEKFETPFPEVKQRKK